MANYYYKRYNYSNGYGISESNAIDGGYITNENGISGATNYSQSGMTLSTYGSGTIYPNGSGTIYNGSGSSIAKFSVSGGHIWCSTLYAYSYTNKGSYVDTISAADGTYPNDGISGSYWYVKDVLAETVTITAPNGGESVSASSTITWTSTNSSLKYNIDLSTDNGQTWKSLVSLTDSGVTSYAYNFINEVESAQCRIRIRAVDGTNYGNYDQSDGVFTILHNVAPTTPTNLYPSGISVDRTKVQRVSWKHNDQDNQSKFDFLWSTDATYWTTITQNTINQYIDISANVFPLGTIYWKVKTYDSFGLESPYSAQVTFVAAEPSNAPVITSANTSAIAKPIFTWSQADQTSYQIQIVDSINTTVLDSNEVISTNRSVICGIDLINGGAYTLKIRTKNASSIWSDYATQTLTVAFTPPAIPTLTFETDSLQGYIKLMIVNPTPVETQPIVTYNEVYRTKLNENNYIKIATNVQNLFFDYTPVSETVYQYRIKAIGQNNTISFSDVYQSSVKMEFAILSEANNLAKYIDVMYNVELQEKTEMEKALMQFAGRKKRTVEFGEHENVDYSLTFWLTSREEIDKLKDIMSDKTTLLYRDFRQNKFYCTIDSKNVEFHPSNYFFIINLPLNEVDFDEEV